MGRAGLSPCSGPSDPPRTARPQPAPLWHSSGPSARCVRLAQEAPLGEELGRGSGTLSPASAWEVRKPRLQTARLTQPWTPTASRHPGASGTKGPSCPGASHCQTEGTSAPTWGGAGGQGRLILWPGRVSGISHAFGRTMNGCTGAHNLQKAGPPHPGHQSPSRAGKVC